MASVLGASAESGPGRVLSAAQREEYWRKGYVVLKGLVPQADLDRYRRRFEEVCRGEVEVPGLVVMKDVAVRSESGERAVNKIQDFVEDATLFSFCTSPGIVPVVQDIVGPDVLAMHTMLINKPPDPGTKTSRHPMHQDLHYFPFRPADRIVCAWTAMEAVSRANGCLVLLPGSHRRQTLHAHGYPQWDGGVNAMYHGILDPSVSSDVGERFYAEMGPGDTVFFHPLLVHGSGANKTSGFRKAISCHYASATHCRYIDVRGTSQESIAKEVDDIVRRKFGPDAELSFQDVWRLRARPVAGIRASL